MTASHGAHRPVVKTELGYGRNVCAECRVDWPCPTAAQAAEDRDESLIGESNPVDEAIDRALARSRAGRAPRRRSLPGVDPDDVPSLRDVADEYPAAIGGPTSDTVADVMARVVWPR